MRLPSAFAFLQRLVIAAVAILAFGPPAMAGWYQVDNYEGDVGGRAIRLSLQQYDFGSGITVEGSYYLEAERRPIAVYGKVEEGRAVLCEISGDAELERIVVMGSKTPFDFSACPVLLTFDADRVEGQWKREGIDHAVALKKVGSLNDRDKPSVEGDVEIPFWAQTATHMLVGRYENTASGICMSAVRFINKASGKIDQELRYGGDPCDAGMLMTPIYMNVEVHAGAKSDEIWINYRDNAGGTSDTYVFDRKAKAYVKTD